MALFSMEVYSKGERKKDNFDYILFLILDQVCCASVMGV